MLAPDATKRVVKTIYVKKMGEVAARLSVERRNIKPPIHLLPATKQKQVKRALGRGTTAEIERN
jgi:hypothetical protein